MTPFLLGREEEGRVTAKNLKHAESPTCTKIRNTSPQVRSSTFYNITTQQWFSSLPDAMKCVLRCYPHRTVKEGHIALSQTLDILFGQRASLIYETDKPPTWTVL